MQCLEIFINSNRYLSMIGKLSHITFESILKVSNLLTLFLFRRYRNYTLKMNSQIINYLYFYYIIYPHINKILILGYFYWHFIAFVDFFFFFCKYIQESFPHSSQNILLHIYILSASKSQVEFPRMIQWRPVSQLFIRLLPSIWWSLGMKWAILSPILSQYSAWWCT